MFLSFVGPVELDHESLSVVSCCMMVGGGIDSMVISLFGSNGLLTLPIIGAVVRGRLSPVARLLLSEPALKMPLPQPDRPPPFPLAAPTAVAGRPATAASLARGYSEGMMHCFVRDSEDFVRSASCEGVFVLFLYVPTDPADHCFELPLCCLVRVPLLVYISWWLEVFAPFFEVGQSVFEYDVSADHHTRTV